MSAHQIPTADALLSVHLARLEELERARRGSLRRRRGRGADPLLAAETEELEWRIQEEEQEVMGQVQTAGADGLLSTELARAVLPRLRTDGEWSPLRQNAAATLVASPHLSLEERLTLAALLMERLTPFTVSSVLYILGPSEYTPLEVLRQIARQLPRSGSLAVLAHTSPRALSDPDIQQAALENASPAQLGTYLPFFAPASFRQCLARLEARGPRFAARVAQLLEGASAECRALLTREDLARFLESPSAELRLASIALLAQVAQSSAPPPPLSPSPTLSR